MAPQARAAHLPGSIGLVLSHWNGEFCLVPYFSELIAGIEEVLSHDDLSLLLHVVPDRSTETAVYERWQSGGMVGGVFVVDVRRDDVRLTALDRIGLPAVVIGDIGIGYPGSAVLIDGAQANRDVVTYLGALGHRRIAYVSGPPGLLHAQLRADAFRQRASEVGIEADVLPGDYSHDCGTATMGQLLDRAEPPTAVMFAGDVMAEAALTEAIRRGVRIPEDLSLVAEEDSVLCQLARPPLTALRQEAHAMGLLAARCMLESLTGTGPVVRHAPTPALVVRATTGPGPAPQGAGDRTRRRAPDPRTPGPPVTFPGASP